MARMSPPETNVCFAISTEADASNFFLPLVAVRSGGTPGYLRKPQGAIGAGSVPGPSPV